MWNAKHPYACQPANQVHPPDSQGQTWNSYFEDLQGLSAKNLEYQQRVTLHSGLLEELGPSNRLTLKNSVIAENVIILCLAWHVGSKLVYVASS